MASSADSEGIGSQAGGEICSTVFWRATSSIRCHQIVNTTATCSKMEVLWATSLGVLDDLLGY